MKISLRNRVWLGTDAVHSAAGAAVELERLFAALVARRWR
jgi:hypothetical protein